MFERVHAATNLLGESVIVERGVQIYESEKMADGCEHTLANMIPTRWSASLGALLSS